MMIPDYFGCPQNDSDPRSFEAPRITLILKHVLVILKVEALGIKVIENQSDSQSSEALGITMMYFQTL